MRKSHRLKKYLYMFLVVLVATVGFVAYSNMTLRAADGIWIEVDGSKLEPATAYVMSSKNLQMNMKSSGTVYDDTTKYKVEWSIEDGNAGVIANITTGSSQTIGILTALSPGEVTITLKVKDRMDVNEGVLAATTCKVKVVFSIDKTKNDAVFKKLYTTSTERSMFLYADYTDISGASIGNPYQLELNFGVPSNAQWTSKNSEVVTVERSTGKVRAVGAGHTTIEASYTPSGATTTYTATLDVYVVPRITDKAADYTAGTYYKSIAQCNHDKGDHLYLDSFFGANNTESLGEKVTWVIMKDSGSVRVPIANSLPTTAGGLRSDLINLDPSNSQSSILNIDAKAGTYYVYFYAKGTYESETLKTTAYAPTMIKLTVYANFGSYEKVLQVGDSYKMADAFNLTIDEFNLLFNSPKLTRGAADDASNYATYNSTTSEVVTKNITDDLRVSVTAKNAASVIALTNPTAKDSDGNLIYGQSTFKIKLNVIDAFQLDRSSATIVVNQELQLNAIYQGTLPDTIAWKSSDTSSVTVDANGKIKGIKITTSDVTITASSTDGNGVVKNATCTVKVEATVTDFTISPNTAQMKVGDTITLKATLKESVSIAPFDWKIEDSTVISIEVAADNKSAVITAKKGGTTKIAVTNRTSGTTQWCTVTVFIPIETMTFDAAAYSAKSFYKTKVIYINYTPDTANATDMVFATSDKKIAEITNSIVKSKGVIEATVSMGNPGTVTLSAYPKYNPYTVMAMCSYTVGSSATGITLNSTAVTLNAPYQEKEADTKQLTYTAAPVGATTTVTYTSSAIDVATVDSKGLITAVKAGTATITVRTEENITVDCKVTVKQPCESIEFPNNPYILAVGATYKPVMKIVPTDSTDVLTWRSYDTTVATVDSAGAIKGIKSGKTFIEVKTATGPYALLVIEVRAALTGLTFNQQAKTIDKDKSFTLTAIYTPSESYDKTVTWSSMDKSIATVVPNAAKTSAVVKGIKGGVTLIRGVSKDGGYVATCLVTVIETATTVRISPTSIYLQKGGRFTATAVVLPTSVTNRKITWSSTNKKIISVSSTGGVKGLKMGTAYVKAKAKDGSGAYAKCKVMVIQKVTSIRLNKYSAKVLVGKTLRLIKYISPSTASIKGVSWSSSDNSIATVDASGRIQGLAVGLVKIRAKALDGSGKTAVCLVNVVEPVEATGVSVASSEVVVAVGRKIQSGIAISPANSTDKISYYSDNKYVATVDKRGKITAKHIGQATVYGKTSNGKFGYCDVLVVGLNRTTLTLRSYDIETIWVNQISTGVLWYSTNPLVASVAGGKITARMPGTTTIYAVVRGIRLPCYVTVKKIT